MQRSMVIGVGHILGHLMLNYHASACTINMWYISPLAILIWLATWIQWKPAICELQAFTSLIPSILLEPGNEAKHSLERTFILRASETTSGGFRGSRWGQTNKTFSVPPPGICLDDTKFHIPSEAKLYPCSIEIFCCCCHHLHHQTLA